jgi:hypothetical protein
MVSKKTLVVAISFIIFYSCCYTGRKSEFGLPRNDIKRLDIPLSYEFIDTIAVYKLVADCFYNKSLKKVILFKNQHENYPYTSYLKFYRNGKLGLFIIPKEDTINLTKKHFNPEKAKMGYYFIEDNKIKTRISTIGDCALYIANDKGTIVGDSITLLNKNGIGNIFVKRKVPKEILEGWTPDW